MNEPKLSISVVVPCHNYARFLPDSLASITGQSRPPDQIILVDDGSTDHSAAVARGIVPGIEVITQPRGGISSARNAGMAKATGEILAFLDADDIWPVDSLARRIAPIEADPDVAGSYGRVDQFICPMADDHTRATLVCPEGQQAARVAGALLVRRDLAERAGPFDTRLKVGETIDWVARLSALNVSFETVDALVLRRRIHGRNTTLEQRDFSDYFSVIRAAARRGSSVPAAS